ncbi:MAG: type II toxin-antitoxin system RelE/ParE family toxin [Magnetococcales bacterium]|nr:type II toxin-antitoxin system RelE/ParE family toxin [Magnetococcales bacterium]
MKVRFAKSARAEFLAAIDYIRQENPSAAREYFLHSEKVLRRLELFPDSGRSLPEFPELPYQEVIIHPYRFVYRVIDATVWIVTVWHGARLLTNPEA